LFLPGYSLIHILKELKVDELCQMVLCAKSFANPIFVLPYPFRQVAGDNNETKSRSCLTKSIILALLLGIFCL